MTTAGSLTLENERKWSTLVHPEMFGNKSGNYHCEHYKVFNEEQKFPEMDAYTISKIYADWTAQGEKSRYHCADSREHPQCLTNSWKRCLRAGFEDWTSAVRHSGS